VCYVVRVNVVFGRALGWAMFFCNTIALLLGYAFFLLSDAMLTTSQLARRTIAGFLCVVQLINWLQRTLVTYADESSVDLLKPLRAVLPSDINAWTAQEALKTLDYGLLAVTVSNIYLTYKRPELVVFMPMRFARTELYAELSQRTERRAAEQMVDSGVRQRPTRAFPASTGLPSERCSPSGAVESRGCETAPARITSVQMVASAV